MNSRKKGIIAVAIAAALTLGGATAAHAATYATYTTCSSGKSVSLHLTGKRLSDGGSELKATMQNGDICYLTSNGLSIGLKTTGIRVVS